MRTWVNEFWEYGLYKFVDSQCVGDWKANLTPKLYSRDLKLVPEIKWQIVDRLSSALKLQYLHFYITLILPHSN